MANIPFNMNDCVRVRLTDHGRKIHRERFRELNAMLPLSSSYKYTPPAEDADGWSKWQMWSLVKMFGEHCGASEDQPFDTNIEIIHDFCEDQK